MKLLQISDSNDLTLIVLRAIQGIATGIVMAVSFAIITAYFLSEKRSKALGIYATSISAGLAIVHSLGGFITFLLGWRYVFLINILIGIAGLLWGRRVISRCLGSCQLSVEVLTFLEQKSLRT